MLIFCVAPKERRFRLTFYCEGKPDQHLPEKEHGCSVGEFLCGFLLVGDC